MKKIKCLQKSSNPILLNKSIVPYGKKIPYMCKLIKYFESDSTIFLLIEYLALGKLSYYLSFLLEYGDSFLANLNNFKTHSQCCTFNCFGDYFVLLKINWLFRQPQ